MVARVGTGPSFSRSQPEPLFDMGAYALLRDPWANADDVSPDGRRFLMIREVTPGEDADGPPRVRVVQNGTQELKRLMPVS